MVQHHNNGISVGRARLFGFNRIKPIDSRGHPYSGKFSFEGLFYKHPYSHRTRKIVWLFVRLAAALGWPLLKINKMNVEKLNNLIGIIPEDILIELRQQVISRVGISDYQIAHLLAQCDHESNGFKVFEENLNYSAKRLLQIFPKRVKTIEKAKIVCSGGKQAIGNFLYNGRMGNVIGSNQGYKFRGRGCIQLTGREHYTKFTEYIGEDCINYPDKVLYDYKLISAFWFFDKSNVWRYAMPTLEAVKDVTFAVNGGYNGLEERKKAYQKYLGLLS